MSDKSQSKERLRSALEKLESLVIGKIEALKEENLKLKQEVAELKAAAKPAKEATIKKTEPEVELKGPQLFPESMMEAQSDLQTSEVTASGNKTETETETVMSLNELKKLVGQN